MCVFSINISLHKMYIIDFKSNPLRNYSPQIMSNDSPWFSEDSLSQKICSSIRTTNIKMKNVVVFNILNFE